MYANRENPLAEDVNEEASGEPWCCDYCRACAFERVENCAGVAGCQKNHEGEEADKSNGEAEASVALCIKLLTRMMEGDVEVGTEQEANQHDWKHS